MSSTCEIINKFFIDFMIDVKVDQIIMEKKGKEFQILINNLINKPEKSEKKKRAKKPKDEMVNYVPVEEGEKPEKSEKKKRAKKPKDAPKNAKSAYMFFCQEMRATVKEENPDLSSKEILAMWKDIKDTEEVEKYNQLATNDKDRYNDEMSNYVSFEEVINGIYIFKRGKI